MADMTVSQITRVSSSQHASIDLEISSDDGEGPRAAEGGLADGGATLNKAQMRSGLEDAKSYGRQTE